MTQMLPLVVLVIPTYLASSVPLPGVFVLARRHLMAAAAVKG